MAVVVVVALVELAYQVAMDLEQVANEAEDDLDLGVVQKRPVSPYKNV